MTGGRIKRIRDYVKNETFCLTYGDGVSDINNTELIEFHRDQKTLATLTAIQPPGRFGAFTLGEGEIKIQDFREKSTHKMAWIHGGFFVLEPAIFDNIDQGATVWEQESLQRLSGEGLLAAYQHTGYWQSMDTLRDLEVLEEKWRSGNAPWKIW